MISKYLVVPAGIWVHGRQNKSLLMLWFLHYPQSTTEENVCVISSACPFTGAGDSLVSYFELADLVQVLPSLLVHDCVSEGKSSLLVLRCRQLLGSFTVARMTDERAGNCRRV